MEDLNKKRTRIDEIDAELIKLINERAKVAKDIGTLKLKQGIGVVDPERERGVLTKVKVRSEIIAPEDVEAIWAEIMSACKKVQGQLVRVAFLGPAGTFAEEAAHGFFPKAGTQFIPAENKWDIFKLIEADKVEFGVIPIENSLQGSVPETLDLLIEKSIKIYGEIELRVIHNLILNPGSNLDAIKTVYSHPQALSQTREWLRKRLPNAEQIETSSTARAVEQIRGSSASAAIGNALAADIYEMEIAEAGIEDNTANFTRFLILSKKDNMPSGHDRTSITFVTKHVPGALFRVLQIFASRNINLLKIESRPRRESTLWEYSFFLDFEGHLQDKVVQAALADMDQHVIWKKVLGSYPRFPS